MTTTNVQMFTIIQMKFRVYNKLDGSSDFTIIWMKFILYTNNALQIFMIIWMKFRLYTNNALQILH
jgi:hypothetical protein